MLRIVPSHELPERAQDQLLIVESDGGELLGRLSVPGAPLALALVAVDRGTTDSPALRAVAHELHGCGFATLVIELLTAAEQADLSRAAALRLDAVRLSRRLHAARETVHQVPGFGALPVVCVGLGGGGPASLLEAAAHQGGLAAVAVDCRWPDVVGLALARLALPVLFVADALDPVALRHSRAAAAAVPGESQVLPLPPEGSRLEAVGRRAGAWLHRHLASRTRWIAPPPSLLAPAGMAPER